MTIKRAQYASEISAFLTDAPMSILGQLGCGQTGDTADTQHSAWLRQIEMLQSALDPPLDGQVLFEYHIPRIGKRVDNILVAGHTILVIEFKIDATSYERYALTQVIDYALDLKNFHAGSRNAIIVPILVASNAPAEPSRPAAAPDGVADVVRANAGNLHEILRQAVEVGTGPTIDYPTWLAAGYEPTPTIIEASQTLYRGHSVKEISRFEAGADNLGRTTEKLCEIIDHAQTRGGKTICFVTGVPGAGKTLAGLNLANESRRVDAGETEHAVFLSGNGPLVKVLCEALARDDVEQALLNDQRLPMVEARRRASAFIQNVHHFRDECLANPAPPVDRVVVFDEAQRAWDRDKTSDFMRRKRGQEGFGESEPSFLIRAMDRHTGWAAIVCLVGGGQEINTGEAGIEEWLRAIRDQFPTWTVYLPTQMDAIEYLPTFRLSELGDRVIQDASLHLGVSLRSFRSERLSSAMDALLTGETEVTRSAFAVVQEHYPVVITRSLDKAKDWIRTQARGSERFGLLASSGARRLRPIGIHIESKVDPCHWFLKDKLDVRSSYYLEGAATEFEVQGLELDWSIVVWDGDFIRNDQTWQYQAFKGARWEAIRIERAQLYRLNAYRVLLTRARQGLAIVVPEGDERDVTRPPANYDPTWQYLCELGLPEIA